MEQDYLLPSMNTPISHYNYVKAFNNKFHKKVSRDLSNFFPELSQNGDFAIVTTGSDGRLEKSPLSKVELILLHDGENNPEKIIEKIPHYLNLNTDIFDQKLEIKNVFQDLSCLYANIPDRVFPTRALDSKLILGNPSIKDIYLKNIILELRDGEKGSKRLERFDSKRRSHKNIFLNCGDKDSKYFNLEDGILFYDGQRVKSTKYSHLRSVQYKLASDLFKTLRRVEGKKLDSDFLLDFPINTLDRISYLAIDKNLTKISPNHWSDISNAYINSLYWYHLSEENFMKNADIETSVNTSEFKEAYNIIKSFVTFNQNIFK